MIDLTKLDMKIRGWDRLGHKMASSCVRIA